MGDESEVQPIESDLLYDAFRDRKVVKDPKTLTKSKFLNGLQCPKLLWTRCNAPETIPPPSKQLQKVFDIGHQVGALAETCFPGGHHVQEDDFLKNIDETRALLSAKVPKPIYEAGVKAGRLYARADILRPSSEMAGAWDVIEVKCGTKVKDVYLQDVAFQRYCYEQAGIKVGRCFLMHINNQYVRHGDIDVEEFFALEDVTDAILPYAPSMPGWVDGFLKIIDLPACPHIGIRGHCGDPYDCQMESLCWAFLPERNVLEIARIGKKGFDLIEQGILRIVDIPDNFKLTEIQSIQRQAAVSNRAHVSRGDIAGFVKHLKYPIWNMDFETLSEAIPRFDGVKPYQQIPFQFSVHLQKSPGAVAEHFEFLHKDTTDPRLPFLKALKACLGPDGTVLAYRMSFERGKLEELGRSFPEYEDWCSSVTARMVDLLIPFQKQFYYHPDQHGSASLKKVLPVLVGKSYKGMAIADGGQAPAEYARVTFGEGVDSAERQQVYKDLEAYCGLDTEAMVDLLDALRAL